MSYLLNILFKKIYREKNAKLIRAQHNKPNDYEYTRLNSNQTKKYYQHHPRNILYTLHKSVFGFNMTDI